MVQRRIAVIGGTGKVGKYIAETGLERGYRVRMLVRDPERVHKHLEGVELIVGDALNAESIEETIQNCDTVINTFGQPVRAMPLYSEVTKLILSQMKEQGIQRYIGVTGGSLTLVGDRKNLINRFGAGVFEILFSKMMVDKRKEHDMLKQSDLAWTLFRLPFVYEGPEQGEIRKNLIDMPGSKISNRDIARFLVEQIEKKTYFHQTPFIAGN
ncbi:NAD(P)-dependent oxidoreductase [Sporosarcina cyprini]|uniref:NAD(P)-dependent oxidoreductase n=1 Tax=Sporosarcina cyprini TaxID=2910523 RepID=UPI001EDCF428|nr:SDR family oxidoreductase [Sporosarcina cyprini]MCG3088911.1 SDR family oxidoreductase [Sporosarcina cyprini]